MTDKGNTNNSFSSDAGFPAITFAYVPVAESAIDKENNGAELPMV
nr:MAG TPA: hypothetical protein [Caudoviricetes sp.]